MKFKAYPPSELIPYAFYVVGMDGVKVTKRGGRLAVSGGDQMTNRRIEKKLTEAGIKLTNTNTQQFYDALISKGMLAHSYPSPHVVESAMRNNLQRTKSTYSSLDGGLKKTPQDLITEASRLDLSTCPFRTSTVKEVSVIVSSNEPPQLESYFCETKLTQVSFAHLPVADIVATNNKTGDTLFIERKTIHDLYASVTNNQRSHDQSERLFDAVNAIRNEGKRARAIWLVESQDDNRHLIHSTLNTVQAVDGLINYFDMINDQSVHQTWGMKHSVYVAAKYIQGFFEQKLFYSVKTNNPSIMRSKQDRIKAKLVGNSKEAESKDTGVIRHTSTKLEQMLSYIPNINRNVAKNLAATGKTFAEILQMTECELVQIKGIGLKSAQLIEETFQMRGH